MAYKSNTSSDPAIPDNSLDRNRHIVHVALATLGTLYGFFFGFENLQTDIVISVIEFSYAIAMLSFTVIALLYPANHTIRWVTITTGSVFFLYLFITGGVEGTGSSWSYFVPIASFYLLGLRSGSIISFSFLLLGTLSFILAPQFPDIIHPNDALFIKRYLGIYLLICIVSVANEYQHQINIRNLRQQIEASRKIHSKLLEKNELINSLLSHSPNPISIFDTNGTILLVSDTAAKFLQQPKEQIIGKSIKDFFSESLACQLLNNVSPVGAPVVKKHPHRLNGKEMTFETILFPVNLEHKNKNLIGSISIDVTQRDAFEQELLTARDRAEIANRTKGLFLANMSHEFRTPLNGVIGMATLLLESDLGEKEKQYAEIIVSSSRHLLGIMNDILDFSKIDAGKMQLVKDTFDLYQLTEKIIQTMKYRTEATDLNIQSHIDPAVPAIIHGDKGKLKQILYNIVGNALKFTHQGSVSLNVTLNSQQENIASVLFSVQDTGVGIPKDKAGLLFEEFTQIDNSNSRKYGGTGLGLAICKKLVEMMGGVISFKSTPDIGSEFYFTIPFAVIAQKKKAAIKPLQEVAIPHKKYKILIAEDYEINQKVAAEILQRKGLLVELADNGMQAIEWLKKDKFDLVLMDIQMPEMDGLEATATIRKSPEIANSSLPIIAMTANAMAEDRQAFTNAGMDDFLGKPFNAKELYALVEKWLPGNSAAL